MEDQSVANFAQEWFDELSHHEPVERLLTRISDIGLEMVFPERTLYGHADFADWYEGVGKAFTDQSHTVEKLRADHRGDLVDVAVTVVWSATQTADGTRSAFRVNQTWQLRKELGQRLRIVKYRVGTLEPIPVDGVL